MVSVLLQREIPRGHRTMPEACWAWQLCFEGLCVSHILEDGVNGVLGTQLLGGEIKVSTWNFMALKIMLSSTPDLPCLL